MTSPNQHQEQGQSESQEVVQPPGDLPRWAVALFGSGVLALTGGWVYLLALGLGYLWHQVF
jgi:hypothetical protein